MSVPSTSDAVTLLLRGQVAAAASAFENVLRSFPNDALAHAGLGNCFLQLGREDEAWKSLTTACRLSDRIAQAFSDLSWLAFKRGELEIAWQAVERALALTPTDAKAHFVRAQLLFQQGRYVDADAAFARAEALNPPFIDARFNIGNQLFERGDYLGASRHYWAYAQQRPQDVQGWINCGLSLGRAGELAAARTALEHATALAPDQPRPWVLLALVLKDSNASDAEQLPVLKRVVELSPDTVELQLQLACVLFNSHDCVQARAHLQSVLRLDPNNLVARWLDFQMPTQLVPAEKSRQDFLDRWKRGISYFENLDWTNPDVRRQAAETIASATSFYLAYLDAPLLEEHRRNAGVLRRLAEAANWTRNEVAVRAIGRKRRKIAVFASSLSPQSIGLVWTATVLGLDRNEFELAIFSPTPAADADLQRWSERATRLETGKRSMDAWIDTVRAFGPDVMLFAGIGMDRIVQALACVRHAPVQATTWAHPVTSGMPTIDYFLSTGACEPDDGAKHYSETLVRLPRLGAYLEPPEPVPPRTASAERPLRLLCVQNADKLHCLHDELFADVLNAVPTAQMDVVCGKPAHVADALATRMRAVFAERGVDFDSRCRVHPGQPSAAYHRFLAAADFCLDSLDFSGCITSLDALWHDLPIVTLPGRLMRGRQTYGMLRLLELDELIALDAADYVRIAIRLAQDKPWRTSLSARIRARKAEVYRDQSTVSALAEFLRTVEPPEIRNFEYP